MREKENLTLLGNQQNNYETDYNPGLLETFVNKHPENDYFVKFNCPEFSFSLIAFSNFYFIAGSLTPFAANAAALSIQVPHLPQGTSFPS